MHASEADPRASAGLAAGLGLLFTSGPCPAADWHDAPSVFTMLDDEGCSAMWFPDHLFWGHDIADPFVMAAVAAASTARCRIGIGVVQLPLRPAAAVAKAAATLQFVAGGRFILGVGSGDHRAEYERAGVDFTVRGRSLDAGIDELHRCWGQPDDWYGQRPVPDPVPVWVGGSSAAALARAARVADGWMPVFETVAQFHRDRATLDVLLGDRSRSPDAMVRGAVALVAITAPSWSRDDALAWVGRLYRVDPGRVDRYLVTGSAEQCAAHLRGYEADHVTVLPVSDRPIDMFLDLNQAFRGPS